MIITDKFIVINFPKTGSTFVRKILTQLSEKKVGFIRKRKLLDFDELELPNIRTSNERYGDMDKHGLRCQVPDQYKHLPMVSVVRNPLDRLVSAYKYGFWKQSFPTNKEEFLKCYPNFPNLSFEEYVDSRNKFMRHTYFPDVEIPEEIGFMSIQLLQFFTRDPKARLEQYIRDKETIKDIRKEIQEISFLRTETLNEDLFNYLLEIGFDKRHIQFILGEKKVNTSRSSTDDWQKFYDDVFLEKMEDQEKLYFDLFPDYRSDKITKNQNLAELK